MGASTSRQLTQAGTVLEAARNGRKMTVSEAARAAGMSAGSWSNMVVGGVRTKLGPVVYLRRLTPSDDDLRAAATAVGVDPDHVLGLDRTPPPLEVPQSVTAALASVPTPVLLAELERRGA